MLIMSSRRQPDPAFCLAQSAATWRLATLRVEHYRRKFRPIHAGGHRLALSDQLNGILAGAYHVHGLAFYRCSTGHEIWRLKDIKKVQVVTLSHDGRIAYCGRESLPLAVINLEKGKIVAIMSVEVRGVRWWQDSPFDQIGFVDGAKPHMLAKDRRYFVKRTTFAFLSAAFAPGLLSLSESGGPSGASI
jgi:hypothetical protein